MTYDHTEQSFQKWHAQRVTDLNAPYGWLSLVSQDWIRPNEALRIDRVPGTWQVVNDDVVYTPDPTATIPVYIDGKAASGPTVVKQGYNERASSIGSAVDTVYGDLIVENITRSNEQGERIWAIRVRDPKESAAKQFDHLDTYPWDADWIIPATFERTAENPYGAATVEHGVLEDSLHIGTVHVTVDGQDYALSVSGHRHGDGSVSGIVHFRDTTNGTETYGAGRHIPLSPEELESLTSLDFNAAISFPCAFTNWVTCPLPPLGNTIASAITAGEKKAPIIVERVQTYIKE
ncbi:DUF1684 domain-containing protein [Bifidobacterium aquikefiricola]|uniref:DUF1684 domain-containing protein n=1 Tax=Bifidobacterium aquikefiricola TaxID=3059038 RepID=A0AB39U8L2_9BIFI